MSDQVTAGDRVTPADIRRRLGSENIVRIVKAVLAHPRFERLFDGQVGLDAWLERAEAHYLNEIDRIGPTKARLQVRRIVNEVALIGEG